MAQLPLDHIQRYPSLAISTACACRAGGARTADAHLPQLQLEPTGLGELRGCVWRIGTMGINASRPAIRRLVGVLAELMNPSESGAALRQVDAVWEAQGPALR